MNELPPTTHSHRPGTHRKWQIAATMIAAGCTSRQVAEKTGVTISAVHQWRRHATFKAFVERIHNEAIDKCIGRLTLLMSTAVIRVQELMHHPDGRIALGACKESREWRNQLYNDKVVGEK